ncbi:MAG TPA: hypothetical protein ENK13_01545 [Thermopetrobacter sp.]|nr:hypothetical protein [Thermopetrobacter sp.]
MSELLDRISAANDGAQLAALATAAGLTPEALATLLRKQVPEVALRIHARATDDEAELDAIFDILEDGEAARYLADPRYLTSRAAVADGEDILAHLYGSLDKARAAIRDEDIPEGVSRQQAERLFTYAATLAVAAMSERYQQEVAPALGLMGTDALAASGRASGGLLSMLIAALVQGIVRALRNALLPRRRRRYSRRYRRYSRSYRRRGYSRRRSYRRRRRRRRRGTLERVLGDLLNGR